MLSKTKQNRASDCTHRRETDSSETLHRKTQPASQINTIYSTNKDTTWTYHHRWKLKLAIDSPHKAQTLGKEFEVEDRGHERPQTLKTLSVDIEACNAFCSLIKLKSRFIFY